MAAIATVEIHEQIREAISQASDRDLITAYQQTGGEPGNPEADTLLSEIERRHLYL